MPIGGQTLQNVGVVYIDLNGLKQLNDSRSHEAGDRYICDAAGVIWQTFLGSSYRIGGDEFVTLAVDMTKDEFDRRIGDMKRAADDRHVNFSLGCAWQTESSNPDDLIKQAERSMYAEKNEYYAGHGGRR